MEIAQSSGPRNTSMPKSELSGEQVATAGAAGPHADARFAGWAAKANRTEAFPALPAQFHFSLREILALVKSGASPAYL